MTLPPDNRQVRPPPRPLSGQGEPSAEYPLARSGEGVWKRESPSSALPQLREVRAERTDDTVLEFDRHILVVGEVLDVDDLALAELRVQHAVARPKAAQRGRLGGTCRRWCLASRTVGPAVAVAPATIPRGRAAIAILPVAAGA